MDGSSNMDNSIRYRIVLGISITTLLIFGLYTFPLSQRTNAQLQSDKLDYKMMASDNNIFSNRWIPPSYVTISLGRNSSEAAGGNNNNNASNMESTDYYHWFGKENTTSISCA